MKLLLFLLLLSPLFLHAQMQVPLPLYMEHPQYYITGARTDTAKGNNITLHLRNQIAFDKTLIADYTLNNAHEQFQALAHYTVLSSTTHSRLGAGYSYRFDLSPRTKLSAGLRMNYWRRVISLPFPNPTNLDRTIDNWIIPEAGIWFDHPNFFAGANVSQSFTISSNRPRRVLEIDPGIAAIIGGRLAPVKNFEVLPSAFLYHREGEMVVPYPLLTLRLQFFRTFWIGGGIRPPGPVALGIYSFMAGMKVKNWLKVGFSYDIVPYFFPSDVSRSYDAMTAFHF